MLFDTDVLIWALRGSKKAAKEIAQAEECFLSAVNYMELMQGARDLREQKKIKEFLSLLDFKILPITEAISHRAMIFVEEHSLKSGLGLADALIFATACEHGMRLCSANEKHFRHITTLETKVFKPEQKSMRE